MNFSLFNFWIPFILIIQAYHLLPNRKWRNLCLLTASYGFYLFVDYRVFPILLVSTLTDWTAGFLVIPSRKKSVRIAGLFASLFVNLGLLCSFKYLPEILNTRNEIKSLLQSVGLPLGISFYTFQTISYTIDCYRGHIKPTKDILSFALYVSFFPQLAAGPIEKAKKLLPQFQSPIRNIDGQKLKEAFYLISLGLFKKVYVAGALIHPLRKIYENNDPPPSLVLLSGSLAIIHLYADFSGYSDLARGIAKCFGIELMINFKPFIFSKNPRKFWSVWHISLYHWISDYLLKSSAKMFIIKTNTHRIRFFSMFILFLLIAFWHGINMKWFVFGVFNAISFSSYRFFIKRRLVLFIPLIFKILSSVIFMFAFHTINGLLYYSNDFETFIKMCHSLMQLKGFGRETFDLLFYLWPFLLPLLIYEWFQNKYDSELFIMKAPFVVRAFWIALVIACIFILERNTEYSFIYFGF